MPDDRLKRTRASLPKGYQFGDAGPCDSCHGRPDVGHVCIVCGAAGHIYPIKQPSVVLSMWEEHVARMAYGRHFTANVIEGDQH